MNAKTKVAAGFGAEVKRRIMLGTYALSAGYYDAYYALEGTAGSNLDRRGLQASVHAGLSTC